MRNTLYKRKKNSKISREQLHLLDNRFRLSLDNESLNNNSITKPIWTHGLSQAFQTPTYSITQIKNT